MAQQTGLLGDRRPLTSDEYDRLIAQAHTARSQAIAAFGATVLRTLRQWGRRALQDRKPRRPAPTLSPYVAPY
jgi:hypothetical protein